MKSRKNFRLGNSFSAKGGTLTGRFQHPRISRIEQALQKSVCRACDDAMVMRGVYSDPDARHPIPSDFQLTTPNHLVVWFGWLARRLERWGLEPIAGALAGTVALSDAPHGRSHMPSVCYVLGQLCEEIAAARRETIEERRLGCDTISSRLRLLAERLGVSALWWGAGELARAVGMLADGSPDARHAWAVALSALVEGEVWTHLVAAQELWEPRDVGYDQAWEEAAQDEAYSVLRGAEIDFALAATVEHGPDPWPHVVERLALKPLHSPPRWENLPVASRRSLRTLASAFLAPEDYAPDSDESEVGEPGTPPVAPAAVTNAIFAALRAYAACSPAHEAALEKIVRQRREAREFSRLEVDQGAADDAPFEPIDHEGARDARVDAAPAEGACAPVEGSWRCAVHGGLLDPDDGPGGECQERATIPGPPPADA